MMIKAALTISLHKNFCSKALYFITTSTHLTCIPQLKLQSTSLTDSDIYPFHRPFSGQKGISKVKRNERTGKRPNQNRVLAKNPCHRHPPHTPLTVVQPYPLHTRLLLSSSRSFSFYNAKHARRRRSTIQYQPPPHPRARSLLNLQPFLHYHPFPVVGSKIPLFLTHSWLYLTSRAFRHSHADGRRALASPRIAFVRQTASSLC